MDLRHEISFSSSSSSSSFSSFVFVQFFVLREGMCISSRRRQTRLICKLCEKTIAITCNFHLLAFWYHFPVNPRKGCVKENSDVYDECWLFGNIALSNRKSHLSLLTSSWKNTWESFCWTTVIGLNNRMISIHANIHRKPRQYIMTWDLVRRINRKNKRSKQQ